MGPPVGPARNVAVCAGQGAKRATEKLLRQALTHNRPSAGAAAVAAGADVAAGVVVAVSLFAGLAACWVVSQVRPTFHDGRALREVAQRPLIGMVSTLPTHALRAMQRRAAWLFAGGVSGLVASYGAAFAFLFLTTRGS